MDNKLTVKEVIPRNENVLISIESVEKISEGIFNNSGFNPIDKSAMPIEYYTAKIEKFGEDANSIHQCPEVKEGMYAIVSQFAGCIVPTEDKYTKIVPGYNIVAISDTLELNEKTINPTADRVLVKLIEASKIQDGVFNDTGDDPRGAITQKAIVVRCAENAQQYKIGSIAYFEPFCGNLIFDDGSTKLKTLNSKDILFTV